MESEQLYQTISQELERLKLRLREEQQKAAQSVGTWTRIDALAKARVASLRPKIKLNIGGELFSTTKTTLLRFPTTIFSVMVSTKSWELAEGVDAHFFDRNAIVFQYVLDYLANGTIRLSALKEHELKRLRDDLEFYCIPYIVDEAGQVIRAPDVQPSPVGSPEGDHLHATASGFIYSNRHDSEGTFHFGHHRLPRKHPQFATVQQLMSIVDKTLLFEATLAQEEVECEKRLDKWYHLEEMVLGLAKSAQPEQVVRLDFRGKIFMTTKKSLSQTAWFEKHVSEADMDEETGAYFIDRNPRFVGLILDFFRTEKWYLEEVDKDLLPELQDELHYFCVDTETQAPFARTLISPCAWNSRRKGPNIILSHSNTVATKTVSNSNGAMPLETHYDCAVLGTSPVIYVKYTHLSPGHNGDNYVMLGLAPNSLNTNAGNNYKTCGYYIFLYRGTLFSQTPGDLDRRFHCSEEVSAGSVVEFKYDRAAKTISIRVAGHFKEFWTAFTNVTPGPLYPAVEFNTIGSAVQISDVQVDREVSM